MVGFWWGLGWNEEKKAFLRGREREVIASGLREEEGGEESEMAAEKSGILKQRSDGGWFNRSESTNRTSEVSLVSLYLFIVRWFYLKHVTM